MLRSLLLVTLLLSNAPLYAAEDTKRIVISGLNFEPTPPYIWFDYCTSQWAGSTIQLAKRIFKELDTQVTFTPPTYRGNADSKTLRQAIVDGEADAILAALLIPYPGITYIETPIIESKLAIFYPSQMGRLQSIDEIRHLQGYYYKHPFSKITKQWIDENQLTVEAVESEDAFLEVGERENNAYLLGYKYTSLINRKLRKFLDANKTMETYYFAIADREPWSSLAPKVNASLKKAKNDGLFNLLHESNLKRWINNKKRMLKCKENYSNNLSKV